MKSAQIMPLALCLALGACAAPTGPSVVAVAPEGVTDANFARDAAACRARAQGVTDAEAANGSLESARPLRFNLCRLHGEQGL